MIHNPEPKPRSKSCKNYTRIWSDPTPRPLYLIQINQSRLACYYNIGDWQILLPEMILHLNIILQIWSDNLPGSSEALCCRRGGATQIPHTLFVPLLQNWHRVNFPSPSNLPQVTVNYGLRLNLAPDWFVLHVLHVLYVLYFLHILNVQHCWYVLHVTCHELIRKRPTYRWYNCHPCCCRYKDCYRQHLKERNIKRSVPRPVAAWFTVLYEI